MSDKKITAVKTPFTKTQTIQALIEKTGLPRKDVISVLDGLSDIIEGHVKKRSCGNFTLPGLLKIKTVKKPARKAQKGVPNPFRPGETMDVAGKAGLDGCEDIAVKETKRYGAVTSIAPGKPHQAQASRPGALLPKTRHNP
jgi:nucleoid DNA-binding protein